MAFFGGPLAITIFSGVNSQRLGRLAKDLPAYLAGVAVFAALVYARFQYPDWFQSEGGSSTASRLASRGSALLLWGGFYLLHARYYRAMSVTGTQHPSPWVPALASIFLALAVSVGVIAVLSLGGNAL